MTKFRILAVVVALMAMTAWGQEKEEKKEPQPASRNEPITKLIRLHNANPENIKNLIRATGVNVASDYSLGAIVIAGPPSVVAEAERMAKELDVKPAQDSATNFEVIVYMIGASQKALPEGRMPSALEPVVKQLRSVFPYQNYSLVDSVVMRSRSGKSVETMGQLKQMTIPDISSPTIYHIIYSIAGSQTTGASKGIQFDEFRFNVKIPYVTGSSSPSKDGKTQPNATTQFGYSNIVLNSAIDIPEGQKVVVGKTSFEGTDTALFLVISAKAVE